ncbi:MAG: substrate-binding domain-containing protein [Verrucomicrobia bacterium]|nr:substrate-binding domain-containing protein [Verrucomicrobiota bacterium]
MFDLLRAAGASRFACISPETETFSVTGRASAFEKLCAEGGFPCIKIRSASQRYDAGRAAICNLAPALHKIDGLFCATDLLALGAIDGLRIDFGLRIPEQIQVVGFDDIEQASWGAYDLTTIRQDLEDQAQAALGLLFARLQAPDHPLQTLGQNLVAVHRGTTLKAP